MPIVDKVVDAIKEAYPEQAQQGTYAVGYCFGGKYVLKLAATEKITAGAVAHSKSVCPANRRVLTSWGCVQKARWLLLQTLRE